MLGAPRYLGDRQRPSIERLGLAVAALVQIEASEVVELGAGLGMVGAARRLDDRQRLDEKRLGLAVAALALTEDGEVVELGAGIGMLGAGRRLGASRRYIDDFRLRHRSRWIDYFGLIGEHLEKHHARSIIFAKFNRTHTVFFAQVLAMVLGQKSPGLIHGRFRPLATGRDALYC